jgi:hypothetical protein
MSSSEQGTAKLPAALDSLECRDSLSNIDFRTSGQSLLLRRIDQTVKHRHALIIEHPFSVADDSKEGRTKMLVDLLKDGLDFELEQILVISYAKAIWLFIHAGYLDFSRIDGPLTELFAISEED